LLVLGLDAVLLIYTCSGYFAHPTVIFDF
jgi:hypothetical protein